MDPIANIKFNKDTTLAFLLEAQRRSYTLFYFEIRDLYLSQGKAYGNARELQVFDQEDHYFELGTASELELAELDILLMRKDPPFDMEYIYTTYILEIAERNGDVMVVNKPQALRDANEKIFAQWFAECMPKTLVTSDASQIKRFIQEEKDVVLKPLHSMGGGSIFRVHKEDVNTNVIIETLTANGQQFIMAQAFIPEIRSGDKRILLINGEPIPYALARIPQQGEIRGNLAAGGTGVGIELTDHDYWICQQIGPTLKQKGLIFVGLDVIGNYLTEINVTSPTCLRELENIFKINIRGQFLDCLEQLKAEHS